MGLDKIKAALVSLLNDKSRVFYGQLLLQMQIVEEPSVGTAGVGMLDGRIYLYYNPKWCDSLPMSELTAVMEHEVMHLIFKHPARKKDKDHTIWNIACDMAINQMIEGLPKDCVFPKNFQLPEGKIAEVYYAHLYKNATKIKINMPGCPAGSPQPCPHGQQGQGKSGEGDKEGDGDGGEGKESKDKKGSGGGCAKSCPHKGTDKCPASGKGGFSIEIETPDGKKHVVDSHSKWDEMTKGDTSLNKESIRQAIKDAYEATQKNRGYIPGNIEGHIKKWLQPPTLSWKQILRLFVGNTIKTGSKFTWKRVSRRYGTSQKGTLPTRTIKMMIGIDTSGSVGDKDFMEFVGEIKGIMSCYKNETYLIQSDAKVQDVAVFKPYMDLEAKFKRHGYGGTDYEPVFKYLKDKQKDTDLCIYLTDFYCSFPKEKPKFPVIWVVTSGGDMNNKPPWGMVVQIKKPTSGDASEGE